MKYRDWEILDDLPDGWKIDNTAGSPAPKTVFITNGKSILSGQQKRALLRVKSNYKEYPNTPKEIEPIKKEEKTEIPIFPAKTVNELARLKFKEKLLQEIRFDLMVCDIEQWDKKEYIRELKSLLNGFNL